MKMGVTDSEAVTTSLDEMNAYAFRNMTDQHSQLDTYYVERGRTPMPDFNSPETLMKSHPKLWPYGRGGFVEGKSGMSFEDRARYLLELEDKRFRRDRSILFEMLAILQKRQVCRGAVLEDPGRMDYGQQAMDHEVVMCPTWLPLSHVQ